MNKDFDFNEIGKRIPYRTPERFFENAKANVLKRAGEEKKRLRLYRLRWGVSIALAVAAMVCGIVFFPSAPKEMPEPAPSNGWVAQTNGETDVMEMYVQGLTDEELEEWIEFSENDIYYELTTENVTEHEN